jgi:hypothetical protein
VSWQALSGDSTGGKAITSYHLQWDKGSSGADWYDVQGFNPSSLSTSTVLTSEVVAGQTYLLRVRASNLHGWGDYSEELSVKAAGLPDQVSTVTTIIDEGSGGVKIEWIQPHDGSEALTSYLIEIANFDTTQWYEDATNCNGDDPMVTSCIVPMETLTADPFFLIFDQLVEVRVTAVNSYGPSPGASEVNVDGARVRSRPSQIPAVTVLSFADTTATLSWGALTGEDAGNSDITSYEIYFDDASGGTLEHLESQTSTELLVQGLEGGETYQFKVQAANIYGVGDFSPVVSVTASNIPEKPSIPLVELQGTDVAISWTEPVDHYSPITSYQVILMDVNNDAVSDMTYDGVSHCDASTDPVFSALSCTLPMLAIPALTGLSVDQLI